MIYLELFFNFLKVGIFSFGGGYSAIPLMRDAAVKTGWITEEMFLDILAIAESTPGPIMINVPTYIGTKMGGLLGGIIATLGISIPPFVVILLFAIIFKNIFNSKKSQYVFSIMRPVIFAIIFYAGISLFFKVTMEQADYNNNIKNIFICILLFIVRIIYKKINKKSISSIPFILISAVFGIVVYAI